MRSEVPYGHLEHVEEQLWHCGYTWIVSTLSGQHWEDGDHWIVHAFKTKEEAVVARSVLGVEWELESLGGRHGYSRLTTDTEV